MAKGGEMKEIKLRGKLDLSMWRGVDDDLSDAIDLSTSSSIGPTNDDPINLTPPTRESDGSTNNSPLPGSTNFLYIETTHERTQENEKLQLHPTPSTAQEQQFSDNDTNLARRESGTKEQFNKGGVKKVEFLQELGKVSMSSDAHGSGSKWIKGLSAKRSARRLSGSLLTEIRKMSLASQDAAEEEKKKQSSAVATPNPTKKIRRYRRRKREEEYYTDKDRAAAVTLGSRDIKQSLKAKKKRERKMHLSINFLSSEEYLASMLVVEALNQLKVRKTPEAALTTLNKALELQPNHKGALVARSQAHLRLGDANAALKDAETSFGPNETFIQGLYQYAEALYQLGEFEKSLIAFHQGYQLRKDMELFRIGVQKSQEAIKRAIGGRKATQMNNLDEILSVIEELQESKRKAVSTCKDEDLLMNILRKRFGEKAVSLSKSTSKCKNQWITREVLGQMYMDKEYLAKFINRPEVKQQTGNGEALRETAKEGLKYLESREKFWRQQNPLYSRKTMVNVINNNSLLSKLSSPGTTSNNSSGRKQPAILSKSSVDKDGQTSFTSTPRSTLKTSNNAKKF